MVLHHTGLKRRQGLGGSDTRLADGDRLGREPVPRVQQQPEILQKRCSRTRNKALKNIAAAWLLKAQRQGPPAYFTLATDKDQRAFQTPLWTATPKLHIRGEDSSPWRVCEYGVTRQERSIIVSSVLSTCSVCVCVCVCVACLCVCARAHIKASAYLPAS